MTHSIGGAALMNQQGASLLFGGHLDQAAKWFQEALKELNFPLPCPLSRPFRITSIPRRDAGTQIIEGKQAYLYAKAFFFNQEALVSEAERSLYASVVLFNLGLAYQIEGQIFQDGGYYSTVAKKLYESSLSHLNIQWLSHDCSNVLIACLNNAACVAKELCCLNEASKMLMDLSTLLKEGRIRTDTTNMEDLTYVALNFELLLLPSCASVA